MATDVEKLLVRVEANLKQYEKEMARARGVGVKSMRELERDTTSSVSRIERSFAKAGTAVKAGFGGFIAGLGAEQLARAAATAIKSIADIGDQATKLGLSNSEFQELQFGAQLAGVEVAALAGGMKKLGINSSDAVRGQGEFGDIVKANNISLTDANGQMRSQVEILGVVANLVSNAANEQDQLAIAQAALGKSGTELMGLLQQGASGVEAAMNQAKDSGVKFTDEQIAKAQEYDDKIDTLIQTISVGLKGAFIDLAPSAESFFNTTIAEFSAIAEAANYVENKIKQMRGVAVSASGKVDLPTALSPGGFKVEKGDADALLNSIPNAPKKTTVIPSKPGGTNNDAEIAAKKTADAIRQKNEQIKSTIDALRFEGEQLNRNNLEQEIHNALRGAGVSARSAEGHEISNLVTANYRLEEVQKSAAENERINKESTDKIHQDRIEQARELVDAQTEAHEEMRGGMMQLAEIGYSALSSVAFGGEKAKDALKGLATSFAEAALQAALLGKGPFSSLLGGGGGGGLFGTIFGGIASIFGGARANGGPISGGKAYMVGERGPEMVVPRSAGTVIPNHALSSGGQSSGSIKIEVVMSEDLRAVVDSKVQDGMKKAVSVSVMQSAKNARNNFGNMAAEHNIRRG